jgi:hypothetical protein
VAAIACDDEPGKESGALQWLVTLDWLS